jgi:hypothetical protein
VDPDGCHCGGYIYFHYVRFQFYKLN